MSFSDFLHSLVGAAGSEPTGRPGVVAVLPEDYLTKDGDERESPWGLSVNAGGAGTRSEIALSMPPNLAQRGVLIENLWVATSSAGGIVTVVVPDAALSGFTDNPYLPGDRGIAGRALLRVSSKNTAAATTATFYLQRNLITATANTYVRLPGRFILRGQEGKNALLIRPNADNVLIAALGTYTALELRSL